MFIVPPRTAATVGLAGAADALLAAAAVAPVAAPLAAVALVGAAVALSSSPHPARVAATSPAAGKAVAPRRRRRLISPRCRATRFAEPDMLSPRERYVIGVLKPSAF